MLIATTGPPATTKLVVIVRLAAISFASLTYTISLLTS